MSIERQQMIRELCADWHELEPVAEAEHKELDISACDIGVSPHAFSDLLGLTANLVALVEQELGTTT